MADWETPFEEFRKVQKPLNGDVVKRIKKDGGWQDWVVCDICGNYCPKGLIPEFPDVHITCTKTKTGERVLRNRVRAKKKELIASNKVGLF